MLWLLLATVASARTTWTGDLVIDEVAELALLRGVERVDGTLTLAVPGLEVLEVPDLVRVQDLVVDGDALTTIVFPALRRVDRELSIAAPATARELRLPSLERVGFSLAVYGGDWTTVRLPRLVDVGHGLTFDEVGLTGPVVLPRLEAVGNGVYFEGVEGSWSLSAPSLEAVGTNLVMREAGGLTSLELPSLEVVGGVLQTDDCADLTRVVASRLWWAHAVLIEGKPALEEVDFASLESVEGWFMAQPRVAGAVPFAPKLTWAGDGVDVWTADAVASLGSLVHTKEVRIRYTVDTPLELAALETARIIRVDAEYGDIAFPGVQDLDLVHITRGGWLDLSSLVEIDLMLLSVSGISALSLERVNTIAAYDTPPDARFAFPSLVWSWMLSFREPVAELHFPALEEVAMLMARSVTEAFTAPHLREVRGSPRPDGARYIGHIYSVAYEPGLRIDHPPPRLELPSLESAGDIRVGTRPGGMERLALPALTSVGWLSLLPIVNDYNFYPGGVCLGDLGTPDPPMELDLSSLVKASCLYLSCRGDLAEISLPVLESVRLLDITHDVGVQRVSAPALQRANDIGVSIGPAPALDQLELPMLETARTVGVRRTRLSRLELPSLIEATGWVYAYGNTEMMSVEAPQLEVAAWFYLKDMPALTTVDLPTLGKLDGVSIIDVGLESLELPALGWVANKMLVSDNPSLRSLDMGSLWHVSRLKVLRNAVLDQCAMEAYTDAIPSWTNHWVWGNGPCAP